MSEKKLAIRFGLGAIKAVGISMMERAVEKRESGANYKDIYDYAKRMDPKDVNKKSVEALAKSGAFDSVADNRRQIFESYSIISAYCLQQDNEANSSQMNFLGELIESSKSTPSLVKVEDWVKKDRLLKEFEAFGYFLNNHPLDDSLQELKKRGIIFSDKINMGEIGDAFIVKMAGVVASSKHRSGPKGRFAYMTISDPMGIYEVMVFDEGLITRARDLLADGSQIMIEAMIRKDEGGTRILVRDVTVLEDFLRTTQPRNEEFEDVKLLPKKRNNYNKNSGSNSNNYGSSNSGGYKSPQQGAKTQYQSQQNQNKSQEMTNNNIIKASEEIISKIKIVIKSRDIIFDIKSFLLMRKAGAELEKTTEVIIKIGQIEVALGNNYCVDEADCNKLSQMNGVLGVGRG